MPGLGRSHQSHQLQRAQHCSSCLLDTSPLRSALIWVCSRVLLLPDLRSLFARFLFNILTVLHAWPALLLTWCFLQRRTASCVADMQLVGSRKTAAACPTLLAGRWGAYQ
jgi:hypothetical protein